MMYAAHAAVICLITRKFPLQRWCVQLAIMRRHNELWWVIRLNMCSHWRFTVCPWMVPARAILRDPSPSHWQTPGVSPPKIFDYSKHLTIYTECNFFFHPMVTNLVCMKLLFTAGRETSRLHTTCSLRIARTLSRWLRKIWWACGRTVFTFRLIKIESLLLSYVSLCTIFKPMRTSAIRKRSVLRYPCLVPVRVP